MAALSQTPGSVIAAAGATTTRVVSGGTITAGMPVYKDAADSNKHKAAKADAGGTITVAGIALNGASTGQPLVICTAGNINLGGTLVVGATYAVSSAAAGAIVVNAVGDLTTGAFVTNLGIATTASNLVLNIDNSGTAKA